MTAKLFKVNFTLQDCKGFGHNIYGYLVEAYDHYDACRKVRLEYTNAFNIEAFIDGQKKEILSSDTNNMKEVQNRLFEAMKNDNSKSNL